MASDNPFGKSSAPSENPFGKSDTAYTPTSAGGAVGTVQQIGRGLLESLPFKGEAIAEEAGIPMPSSFPERLARRASRNLPYALGAAATGFPATVLPAAAGYVGATALGQAAEEFGVPESYQPIFEISGSAVPQAGRKILGQTLGFIEPKLAQLTKKAKTAGYEVGPGARSSKGLEYGAGATQESNIRNLDKFTYEATSRSGNPTKIVDSTWIEETGKKLGNEINPLFAGKIFTSTPKYQQDIANIVDKAEGMFGEQGNVAKTIIEKNIGGQRTGGTLLSPQFKAEDLRGAIKQVNSALSTAKGPQASVLHDLKDSLEDLVAANLKGADAQKYLDWRKKYNSYATIRDLIQLEGATGVTRAGQLNPSKLLDKVVARTGGNGTRSPLYENLAEFGDIFKAKEAKDTNFLKEGLNVVTENELAQALQTLFQPRVQSRAASRGATAQTFAPAIQYTQQPEKNK